MTISSEMVLLSTVIALHTCHILGSIALTLMLLGSITIEVRVLRKMGTLLRLVTMVRPLALGPVPLATYVTLRGAYIFMRSFFISRCFEIASKSLMFQLCVTMTLTLIVIRKSSNHIKDLFFLRNFLPYSFKISNYGTHGSKVFRDTTTRVNSTMHPF